jgi:hypothetical protein
MLSNLIENIPDQTISKNITDIINNFKNNKLTQSINITIHTKGDELKKDLYNLLKKYLSDNLLIEYISEYTLDEKHKHYRQYNFTIQLKKPEYILEIESLIMTFLNKKNISQWQVSIL